MSKTITAAFETRRDAEMAVERLVQEFGLERTDIFIAAEGSENTAGVATAGSDSQNAPSDQQERTDGAHQGAVTVSVDINDDAMASRVTAAFDEFSALSQDEE